MSSSLIPLSVPDLAGNEWAYVKECLDTGWISSAGSFVSRFESELAAFCGAPHAIACVNGTAALHIALMLAGVQRGHVVLVPNLTFVATLNALTYLGAEPVLIDAEAKGWQWDLDLLEDYLSNRCVVDAHGALRTLHGRRVSALLPVHVLGNMSDVVRLQALAERFGVPLVEDSTEALGSRFGSRHAGTFGLLGTFSFNGNKIISTGGGGMILTSDKALATRAKHLTTTAKCSADEYYHDEVGYNYRLVNVLAAIGVAQLERLPAMLTRKAQIATLYRQSLREVPEVRFQHVDAEVSPNQWLQTVWVDGDHQRGLMQFLAARNIQCRPFWVPMNRLPMYRQAEYVTERDVAGSLYTHCVSLPSSSNLTDDDVHRVAVAICDYFAQ